MDVCIYPRIRAVIIYEALCFDVAQGRLNGAPNVEYGQLLA